MEGWKVGTMTRWQGPFTEGPTQDLAFIIDP